MKPVNILLPILIISLFFFGQQVQAQPAGFNGSAYNNAVSSLSPYSNPNSASSQANTGFGSYLPQSINNPFQSLSNSMPPSMSGYNMLQTGGLFNGQNYYIYPPSGNPPDTLIANKDGSYNIYPADGTQPEKVIPNNDGSYSIYPPGYNPSANNGTTDPNTQPEKVVPTSGGGYYIYPPFPGMPPQQVIPNGNGTYNIYPSGGPIVASTAERVVPMGTGQSSTQTQVSNQMPTQAPIATPATAP